MNPIQNILRVFSVHSKALNLYFLTSGLLAFFSGCKSIPESPDSAIKGLTAEAFDQQFEITRLTTCTAPNAGDGGDLRAIWRMKTSSGQPVSPYILGFAGNMVSSAGARIKFQILTTTKSNRPRFPSDHPADIPVTGYIGVALQLPSDEAAAKWGFVEIDGANPRIEGIDIGELLLPREDIEDQFASTFFLTLGAHGFTFKCKPLDAIGHQKLKTLGDRDGRLPFKGDRGPVVKSDSLRAGGGGVGRNVTQWSCTGNRRLAINHHLTKLRGGWFNQEEYCEWNRSGTPPADTRASKSPPSKLMCMIRSSFDQGREYFLQSRLYRPLPSEIAGEGFKSAGDFKSTYYDTKFNGYSFLVGGTEGYHVWDSRVWKRMGQTGHPRDAYITDIRKGIIGHCMQNSCSEPDEVGYTGNCVLGRQSDPLICSVVNAIYCSGGSTGCKKTEELDFKKRAVINGDTNHINKWAMWDPALNPKLKLMPAQLLQLNPSPVVLEDVLFRSDYTPPTRLGDTPIKLDLIAPTSLPECKHIIDPAIVKSGLAGDEQEYLRNDKTLMECNFPANTKFNNCDEVASQIQVRVNLDTKPLR